jgi:hypothetical protein
MSPAEMVGLLVGKIIASVDWESNLTGPMCVSRISFTDGTSVEFDGSSDYARINNATLPDVTWVEVGDT